MLLGKVVGTLVATQKDEKLEGFKLLVVKRLNIEARKPATISSPPTRFRPASVMWSCMPQARQHGRPC